MIEPERRDCLVSGCPNVDHLKETTDKAIAAFNNRMGTLNKTLIAAVIFSLGSLVTVAIWASDKKGIQDDKIARIEVRLEDNAQHWDEQSEVNKELLKTLKGINDWMIEQKVREKLQHPEEGD